MLNRSIIYAIKSYGIRKCLFSIISIIISDSCIVSFKKNGKTWLKVVLAKVLALKYGSKEKLDTQLMTLFKPAPKIMFSHAGNTKKNSILDFRRLFRRKRIVFLARDPRDQVVSLFHDATKRTLEYEEGNISNFIRGPKWGVDRIIGFMNLWAEEMSRRKEDFLLVKYEDMKKDTRKELKRILGFLNIQISDEIIEEAVKYGSFENMRKMEIEGTFKDWRMRPGDVKDPDSYKTRRGKVGSHNEELSKEVINYINQEIKEKLCPIFRY